MLIDQESASIIKYMLAAAGDVKPYYHEVPEDFRVPAIYFPVPEVESSGYVLGGYAVDFTWYPKVYHSTTEGAYEIGMGILTAIQRHRNLIPLIDVDGHSTGTGIRLKDPTMRRVDSGAVQLEIRWKSVRDYYEEDATKMVEFEIDYF